MVKLNLFVPEWRDSGHSNEIFHGSHALRRLVGSAAGFAEVAVPEDATLAISHDIYGYAVVLEQLRAVRAILETETPERLFVLGGGCGVEVPVVSYLADRYADLELFWFDAHGDINSPASSPSKYFHGMPLRFLVERIEDNEISDLVPQTLAPSRITLLGTRDLDAPEEAYIRRQGIRMLSPAGCADESLLRHAIGANNDVRRAYLHLDLDVIDPGEYCNVKCPAAGGLTIDRLASIIDRIREAKRVVGMSILENMETERGELEKLRPLLNRALEI